MLMKSAYLLFIFLAFISVAFAQERVIRGKISAEDGRVLEGVTVQVKGTGVTAISTSDGSFSISVPANATTLVVSSIGYLTTEQEINGNYLEIRLITDDRRLSEVVVVGYGQTQKRAVSGAISRIASREIENQPVQSF